MYDFLYDFIVFIITRKPIVFRLWDESRVVDMNILYSRGEVDTPIRIRIA